MPGRSALLPLAGVVVGVLLLVLLGLGQADASSRLAVTGYQEESSPVEAIARSAPGLTVVGVDGVNLSASGASVSSPDAAALRQLRAARRSHLGAILLFGNFDDAIGDFSEPLAHRLLGDPGAVAAVAQSLASVVAREGWDGVSVDLESLTQRDEAGLTAFLVALRTDLPSPKTVAIDVMNESSAAGFASGGYDLPAIARTVDTVVLMAYDQHGTWENTPGPVGALAWQRGGLGLLLRSVPPAKVELGVAGYGYAWRPHANVQLSDPAARRLVRRSGGHARFVARIGEWTARLRDGSTVWWSDARSYALRVAIARADHLQGLAVWSLGLADRIR